MQADKKGRYDLKKVAAGNYEISIEAAGYDPYFAEVTVKASTTARANVTITNAMSSAAANLAADETAIPLTKTTEAVPDMKVA